MFLIKLGSNADFPFVATCGTTDVTAAVGVGGHVKTWIVSSSVNVPWACLAAYIYVLRLEPASRAWEFLRRNPRYVREWTRYHRNASQGIAARWGLATLVDPRLDAREASPLWVIGIPPAVALVREEMCRTQMHATGAEFFSLWRLAGRKKLLDDGSGFRLVVRLLSREVQLRLGDRLTAGDRFAYQIPADGDERAAWAALTAFRTVLAVAKDEGKSARERPGRADLFHLRALQVLDGLAAGASQRELAVALFGGAAVARGWQPDGALRAQVRYLVRKARAMTAGEYRSLIAPASRSPSAAGDQPTNRG